jgi:hypothetical protein
MILTKLYFLKHPNKAEFQNLDDSKVFSSDFTDLRNLISLNNLISLRSLQSYFHKNLPGTKLPLWGINHQNPIFN